MANESSNNNRTTDNGSEFTVRYYSNGQPATLELEPAAYAVRYKPNIRREPRDPYIEFVPKYGLHVYRARGRLTSRNELLRSIEEQDQENDVEYATPVFRRSRNSEDLIYVTNQFVVKLKSEVTIGQLDALNTEQDVTKVREFADREYVLQVRRAGMNVVDAANNYFETGLFDYAEPDLVKRRALKVAPSPEDLDRFAPTSRSEFLSKQWHLTKAKVTDAWDVTIGASSVQVAILDDGVDTLHAEFAGRLGDQHDFSTGLDDGSPKTSSDRHGTACAGVAVSGGVKAYGAAPGCKLMAVRYPTSLGVIDEAEMFRWTADHGASVISCSWGPPDGHGSVDPIPGPTASALDYCWEQKGIPIFWAAGNGSESVDDDGYASYRNVIAVGASTTEETKSWYSDTGNAVSICAPSNGGSLAIFTTDRRGSAGYNTGSLSDGDSAGDYTNNFGGTSSATPLVAGIAALMLSVKPNLTPAKVREILEKTADRIDESGGNYTTSPRWGLPYKHSAWYGHGRVNARKAVDAAINGINGSIMPTPTTGGPTITGPSTFDRSSSTPPSFTIDPSPHSHFAVEVCSDWQLLGPSDSRPERMDANFYASWRTGTNRPNFSTGTTFSMPAEAWSRLRWADRLFFRVCTSSSSEQWEETRFSIRSSEARNAPSMSLTGSLASSGGGAGIRGPVSFDRGSSTPPTFDIDPSPHSHYAVEVASDWNLFPNSDSRSDSNFYGSWRTGTNKPNLSTGSTFTLPTDVWQRINGASRLYYRVITTASSTGWQDHRYSTRTADAASAPFTSLTGTRSVRDVPTEPREDGGSEVVFASGARFRVIADSDAPAAYQDPHNRGVPLIDVQGRGRDYLTANFRVREFSAANAPHARISAVLVDGLQRLRDGIGPMRIMAGYIRTTEVTRANGAAAYLLSGTGVVIYTNRRSVLQLARSALEHIGLNLTLGLYPDRLMVALSSDGAHAWASAGAEMSSEEFTTWMQQQITEIRGRLPDDRRPSIDGPSEHVASAMPPQFLIDPRENEWFGIEVATRPELLDASTYGEERSDSPDFFASYRSGLLHAKGQTVCVLPDLAWERLRTANSLYYRVLTSSSNTDWKTCKKSLPDAEAQNAPFITIISRTEQRDRLAPTTYGGAIAVDPAASANRDEDLWLR